MVRAASIWWDACSSRGLATVAALATRAAFVDRRLVCVVCGDLSQSRPGVYSVFCTYRCTLHAIVPLCRSVSSSSWPILEEVHTTFAVADVFIALAVLHQRIVCVACH